MNTAGKTGGMDRKVLLSTLWVFAVLNYLYCDVVGLMDSGILKGYVAGNVGGMQITRGFLLGATALMEIPTAMIVLSRVLRFPANRWANIIAGIIMTLVQIATLFVGSGPAGYYIFSSTFEIAATALIVVLALRWRTPETRAARND